MIGEAFHTYFNVSDVGQISLQGLEGTEYSDKVQNYDRDTQHEPVHFDGEFDRVYVNAQQDCVIDDPGYQRRIRIRKSGSNSTVVWTPWEEKAHQLGDMGTDDSWRHMICIESANALENMVMVRPGQTHTLAIEYALESR
jgi:glucose-6-phosphate 1-epimerase